MLSSATKTEDFIQLETLALIPDNYTSFQIFIEVFEEEDAGQMKIARKQLSLIPNLTPC